ncbi:hypothetical protein BSG1_03620 [Bacillus sp. SG-1]|nr:hypothetical protein BSG1_03620 [Bacillus sp. SG-1]
MFREKTLVSKGKIRLFGFFREQQYVRKQRLKNKRNELPAKIQVLIDLADEEGM